MVPMSYFTFQVRSSYCGEFREKPGSLGPSEVKDKMCECTGFLQVGLTALGPASPEYFISISSFWIVCIFPEHVATVLPLRVVMN